MSRTTRKSPINYQLTLKEVGGNENKLVQKFFRKVKKLEITREHLNKTSYHKTKSQKRREKQRNNAFLRRKEEKK